MKDYMEVVQSWLTGDFDPETKCKIIELKNNDPAGLEDAFYKNLEFGTGGLRGIMGVGTNRMNKYTVGMATQGLANYILKNVGGDDIKVCISYDSRNHSKEFAKIAADVMSANGIHVYIFDNIRPTPEMSYAVRLKGAVAGIMITASHNPKEYNGYKVSWSDGGQVTSPVDKEIVDEVSKITEPSQVKFQSDTRCGYIETMGKDVDELYLRDLLSLSLSPEACEKHSDLKIVYTPLHGCGVRLVPEILKRKGFKNVIHVPDQDVSDGNFPTVFSPNPEEHSALEMALAKAEETGADLVLATDPDADRMGIAVRDNEGKMVLLNGNQTAMIFLYYIIRQLNKLGKITGKEYIVKTIVTTEVISEIARKNNMEMFDCYTGFKWIAKVIADENAKGKKYVGGGEESFGFLAEDFVRDKDAVSACSLMAEIAAWGKENGKTLFDMLLDAYQEYGFSEEQAVSVVKPGKSGADEIKAMMEQFRANPPKTLAGEPVVLIKDFKLLRQTAADGTVTELEMPEPSNVLQYFTAAGDKISVRPSGTEPKIKFYMEAKLPMASKADYLAVKAQAGEKINLFKKDLGI